MSEATEESEWETCTTVVDVGMPTMPGPLGSGWEPGGATVVNHNIGMQVWNRRKPAPAKDQGCEERKVLDTIGRICMEHGYSYQSDGHADAPPADHELPGVVQELFRRLHNIGRKPAPVVEVEPITGKHPMQAIQLDDRGVARFTKNVIVSEMVERFGDLNAVAEAFLPEHEADYAQLTQMIGYSVCGWGNLHTSPEAEVERAHAIADALGKGEPLPSQPVAPVEPPKPMAAYPAPVPLPTHEGWWMRVRGHQVQPAWAGGDDGRGAMVAG